VFHGHHGVVHAEVDQGHGPLFELPCLDFPKIDDLCMCMPVVGDYASVKIIDNASLPFEHLYIQALALAQHPREVMGFVKRPGCFQNLGGDGGGLWPHRTADVNQSGKHRNQSVGFLQSIAKGLNQTVDLVFFDDEGWSELNRVAAIAHIKAFLPAFHGNVIRSFGRLAGQGV